MNLPILAMSPSIHSDNYFSNFFKFEMPIEVVIKQDSFVNHSQVVC